MKIILLAWLFTVQGSLGAQDKRAFPLNGQSSSVAGEKSEKIRGGNEKKIDPAGFRGISIIECRVCKREVHLYPFIEPHTIRYASITEPDVPPLAALVQLNKTSQIKIH